MSPGVGLSSVSRREAGETVRGNTRAEQNLSAWIHSRSFEFQKNYLCVWALPRPEHLPQGGPGLSERQLAASAHGRALSAEHQGILPIAPPAPPGYRAHGHERPWTNPVAWPGPISPARQQPPGWRRRHFQPGRRRRTSRLCSHPCQSVLPPALPLWDLLTAATLPLSENQT